MKKINLILMTFMLVLTLPVSAATIAYWDMADPGASDQGLMPGNASREADISGNGTIGPEDFLISSEDLTGNGNHLSAWTSSWMKWTATSIQGDFAMEATNNYPDSRTDSHWSSPAGIDVEAISPTEWTIECVFQATAGTNRCLVGRIGYQLPGVANQSVGSLYLAERSNQRINCEFADVAGNWHNAMSPNATLVAGTWYHVAAVSDGTTLQLYLKNLTAGTDYQVVATADLSASSDPSIIRQDYDPSNWAKKGSSWTVACGTYDNNTGDRFLSPGKIDMVAISDDARAPGSFAYEVGPHSLAAYDPDPRPVNDDGSVGTLNVSNQAELTLNFKAGRDPNEVNSYPVNPAILKHYVWLGTAADSLAHAGTLDQVHNADPALTDPANALQVTLDNNTTYYWQVEEGLDNGQGAAYPAGDPNNALSPVWSFTTVAAIPIISTHPKHTTADASGNASFSVKASATATDYRWFKVGTPDQQLSDIGIYSGTQTNTLIITGAAFADEGQYYCVAYNGDPDAGGAASLPSTPARLWTQRMVSYWKLDGDMTDSVDEIVPGAAVHDGAMNTGDPNYLDEASSVVGTAMSFHNDGQYVTVADSDYYYFFRDGFTMSCWFKDTGDDGWRVFYSKLDAGTAGWLFGKDATATTASFIIDVPYIRLNSGTSVNVADGEWHLLTVTYDGASDSLKMFVDGDQHAQGTIDLSNAPLPTTPVAIGGLGTDAVNGAMDDVLMYSYALTPVQVAEMYVDIKPGSYICAEVENGIGAYDLNDDCRVNLADFALMAAEWLECQRVPASACNW